jgi:MFS family permease
VFAVFLFLTYYLQLNLGYSPLKTGLAFIPMTLMIVLTATTVQTRVLPRTGARPIVITGMTLGIIAMLLFTRLTPHGAYVAEVLPSLLLTGIGMGCIFAPAFATATLGVGRGDAGIASAMVNTSQQVGGSVGTALLSTIFASAAASYATAHAHAANVAGAASIHGYTTAFYWAAALFGVGLLVALFVLPSGRVARARVAQAETTRELSLSLETT